MGRLGRSTCVVAVGLLLGSVVTGCGGAKVRLDVTPASGAYDAAPSFVASGLDDDQDSVGADLAARDAHGTEWTAQTEVPVHGGRVSAATGHAAMVRLISGLSPEHGSAAVFDRGSSITLHLDLMDGDGPVLASATFRRTDPLTSGAVTRTELRPAHGGIYGNLYRAKQGPVRSAVVVLGGSEGGLSTVDVVARLLAARGHPTLALAYFHEPGLPATLTRVPLEYFRRAVQRLAKEPGVRADDVYLWGASRGSEAVLQTAIDFPGLVKGVIAYVPSAVVLRTPDRATPAWTLHGRPVPYSTVTGQPDPPDQPKAAIQPQRYAGRVLLACAGDDQVWPSCPYAEALRQRDPDRVTVHTYPTAGHGIGFAAPYLPGRFTSGTSLSGRRFPLGGTPGATAAARADMWPRVLAFLDGHSGG